MTQARCAIVALMLGVAALAAYMPLTSADPSKIISGDVYGPGGDVSPAATNPANAANATFYSTSSPAYTILSHADLDNADGTNPASFAWDVGATWTWTVGDEVVVVVETVNGMNGWTGASFTTSADGIMATGGVIQDIGTSTLEPYPTITRSMGVDFVYLSWNGLTDTNGNVVSYSLFRGSSPVGPFTFYNTLPAAPSMSFNDSFLSAGQYCYVLGVNYRRDNVGGIYGTTGRSQPVCASLPPPWIASTSPANNAGSVAVNAPVVITFSEAMNTGSVTWTTNPSITLPSAWSGGNTILTLSHPPDFAICTPYTFTVLTGTDTDGNALIPGTAPNPWTFTTVCANPYILTTSPVNNTPMIRTNAPIVITFSEPMNTGSVVVTVNPALTNPQPAWTGGNTVLQIDHDPFQAGVQYQVDVTGSNPVGAPLIPGPVPNPWWFTTNNPPTVAILAPTVLGSCTSGGTDMIIRWQMSDTETAAANMKVWLNYSATTSGTIAGPLTGLSSPATHTWTTPALNEPVNVLIDVVDEAGDVDRAIGIQVEIDSIRPTATLTQPSPGATNVATDTSLIFAFSESMNRTAVEGALSFNPSASSIGHAWSNNNQTLTVTHAPFLITTTYTLNLSTGAKDDCSPGLGLASDYQPTFTTGAGPKAPKPPTGLIASSVTTSAITLTWIAPTQYTDNSSLPASEIASYRVYRSLTLTGSKTNIGSPTQTTFTDSTVVPEKQYFYWVTVVDVASVESDYSAVAQATTPASPGGGGGLDWVWIAIPIIVILLIIGLILLMRRKKPEEAPPTEEVPPAEEAVPPPEEGEAAPPGPEVPPEQEAPADTTAPPESKDQTGS